MRRTLSAVVILLLIFTMWFFEVKTLSNICQGLIEKSESLEKALNENENIQKAQEDFFVQWEKSKNILNLITSHDDTEEINLLSVRLKIYMDKHDVKEALVIMEEIKEHAKEITEKSKVDISTVFYISKGGLYASSN
ncbi:MAG: DUF4363 family protein [Clostridia bacterium]